MLQRDLIEYWDIYFFNTKRIFICFDLTTIWKRTHVTDRLFLWSRMFKRFKDIVFRSLTTLNGNFSKNNFSRFFFFLALSLCLSLSVPFTLSHLSESLRSAMTSRQTNTSNDLFLKEPTNNACFGSFLWIDDITIDGVTDDGGITVRIDSFKTCVPSSNLATCLKRQNENEPNMP